MISIYFPITDTDVICIGSFSDPMGDGLSQNVWHEHLCHKINSLGQLEYSLFNSNFNSFECFFQLGRRYSHLNTHLMNLRPLCAHRVELLDQSWVIEVLPSQKFEFYENLIFKMHALISCMFFVRFKSKISVEFAHFFPWARISVGLIQLFEP